MALSWSSFLERSVWKTRQAFSPKNQKGVPSWYWKCSGWSFLGWMLPCCFDPTQRKEPACPFRPASAERTE
jgi:hypothetical protein